MTDRQTSSSPLMRSTGRGGSRHVEPLFDLRVPAPLARPGRNISSYSRGMAGNCSGPSGLDINSELRRASCFMCGSLQELCAKSCERIAGCAGVFGAIRSFEALLDGDPLQCQ